MLFAAAPVIAQDTDGDGVTDAIDLDNDNDGILDRLEGGPNCVNSATNDINTPGYTINTNLVVADAASLTGLGNGSLNFTATLSGATWGNGVQIKNDFPAIGNYIYLQPISGAGGTSSRAAIYTLTFPNSITGFAFVSAGLNSHDTYEITAFNGAVPVVITLSNLSSFNPVLNASNWTTSNLGNGVKVVGLSTTGGTSVQANTFVTTIDATIRQQ